MKSLDSEIIRALNPIFLTGTGGFIALVLIVSSLLSPNGDRLNDGRWMAAMSLAGTAVGAGAGITQPNSSNSRSN